MKIMGSERAMPNRMKLINVPTMLTISSGRRPYRSESRPMVGAAISWLRAFTVPSSPTSVTVAPKVSA